MTAVIKAYGPVGPAHGTPSKIDGQYVKSYDPDAFAGCGDAQFTDNVEEAMKFHDKAAALVFAFQQPKSRPTRADGHPNRPLLAFTLEFMDAPGSQT